jgi:hypothetical protein
MEVWFMILLQIVCVIFGLLMMYVVRIHRVKEHLQLLEFQIWLAIWFGFIFLTIFPQTFSGLAQTLKIARVFDLLVIIAFMVLTYLTFTNRIMYKKLEKKLEQIIRKKTLDEKK